MDIMQVIKDQIEQNAILLYMKGSPNQPMCGFFCPHRAGGDGLWPEVCLRGRAV